MAASARRHCRWRAPVRRGCRVPARPESPRPWPPPNPCCPAFAGLRCAAALRARTPSAAAP
eukprot:1195233-Rhodomonas_salina.1